MRYHNFTAIALSCFLAGAATQGTRPQLTPMVDDPVFRTNCDDPSSVRPTNEVYWEALSKVELTMSEAIQIAMVYAADERGFEEIEVIKAELMVVAIPYYRIELYTRHFNKKKGRHIVNRVEMVVGLKRKKVKGWFRKNRFPGLLPSVPMTELPNGMHTAELFVGDGEIAREDSVVKIDYTALLLDGTLVINTYDENRSPEFRLSQAEIEGLKLGILGMRTNGKRKLVIPPDLAFGAEGRGDHVPPGATLVYDVELRFVR